MTEYDVELQSGGQAHSLPFVFLRKFAKIENQVLICLCACVYLRARVKLAVSQGLQVLLPFLGGGRNQGVQPESMLDIRNFL